MPKLIYTGPLGEVYVPLSDTEGVFAKFNEPTEFPADLAESLLEQDIWQEAPKASKPAETKEDSDIET